MKMMIVIRLLSQIWYLALCLPLTDAWITHRNSKLLKCVGCVSLTSSSSNVEELVGPPYLAVITEPDSCDSEDQMKFAIKAISSAISTQQVSLVAVRIAKTKKVDEKTMEQRVKLLLNEIVALAKGNKVKVVVSSDWAQIVEKEMPVGIHIKERHQNQIPDILGRLGSDVFIGTSAHSVDSALNAVSKYNISYLFVGTCFTTASHPEKEEKDLEGPSLPGEVRRVLRENSHFSIVFAIGGINEDNCHIPVLDFGADGVAAIRAILRSSDPADAAQKMRANMLCSTAIGEI